MPETDDVSRRTRWSNEEMSRALKSNAERVVLPHELDVLMNDDAAVAAIQQELVGQFVNCLRAENFFAERQDIVVTRFGGEVDPTEPIILNARWAPQVTDVELVGGQMDGHQMTVDRVGTPVFWATVQGRPGLQVVVGTEAKRGVTQHEYRLGGWCERRRCWLYLIPSEV